MSVEGSHVGDRRKSQIVDEVNLSKGSQNNSSPKRQIRDSVIMPRPEEKTDPKKGLKTSVLQLPLVDNKDPNSILKKNGASDMETMKNAISKFNTKRTLPKDSEYRTPKELEDKLTSYHDMKLQSLQKQEEIINNSSIPHKKELLNTFNISKNKYMSKPSDLKNLGPLSVKLEEMRLSIEKRYEYMLYDLNQRLEAIKKYFNNMINEAKSEAFNSIVNEKDQNLSNIKENLEVILYKMKTDDDVSAAERQNWEGKEKSFQDFFEFFENFKEECFNSIVSKPSQLNIESLKKQLAQFKTRNLENLLTGAKVFTSNLLRFFEHEIKQYDEQKDLLPKNYGDVVDANQESTENSKFYRLSQYYDPELNAKSKTPMICVINNRFMVVVTRDMFRLVQYQYTSGNHLIPRSKFYQNFHQEKGEFLNFIDVFCSSDIGSKSSGEKPSFHSVCAVKVNEASKVNEVTKIPEEKYLILLGGNDLVVTINPENLHL